MKRTMSKISKAETVFLPMISNDLQSLARAILAASERLSIKLHESRAPEDPYIRECLQLIRSASNCVMPLTGYLTNLEKSKENSMSIKPAAVYNLRQQLEYVRNVFSHEAQAKQIEISLSIENDIPVIYCDIDSLRLLTLNTILSNVICNTPVGGKISILVTTPDDYTMTIKISNSENGIPAFDGGHKFRNLLKSDNFSGLGVNGLQNAQFCVLAHKGSLCVVDEPEFSGLTFKIDIPLFALCIQ